MGDVTEELENLQADSMQALNVLLPDEASCIAEGFGLLAETRKRLREASESTVSDAARFLACAGDAFTRCERLCLARYWLALVGLNAEGKGLLRSFIEGVEALHWLAEDPGRIVEVQFGCAPKAGLRARSVGSPYREARRVLSEESVHLNLRVKWEASKDGEAPRSDRLGESLVGLFANQSSLLIPGVSCLAAAGEPNYDLADRAEEHIRRGFKRLKIIAIASFGIPEGISEDEEFDLRYRTQWPEIIRYP
jgi:hypothetical protein